MGRRERIVAGVVGLLVLAWVAPDLVGALLMLFSVLVFVIAVVGLMRPSLVEVARPHGGGVGLHAVGWDVRGRWDVAGAAERREHGVGFAGSHGADA